MNRLKKTYLEKLLVFSSPKISSTLLPGLFVPVGLSALALLIIFPCSKFTQRMKQFCLQQSQKLVVCCGLLLWLFMIPSLAKAEVPPYFFTKDTTVVQCDTVAAYTNWIDNKIFALTNSMGTGNTVTASPPVNTSFMFATPCGDTVTHILTLRDGSNAVLQIDTVTLVVKDEQVPTFMTLPSAIDTVGCLKYAHPDSLGRPTAIDNCDTLVEVTFLDNFSMVNCPNDQTIQRIWSITDDCGNTNTFVQTILVIDTIPPSFTIPADTVISCEFGDSPTFTGEPTIIQNDCDSLTSSNYRFEDQLAAGGCANGYVVMRKWFVFDNCNNIDSAIQRIEVVDSIAPIIGTEAQNLIVNCMLGVDLDTLYQNWLDRNGGAVASDNCTVDTSMIWSAIITGTSSPALIPSLTCNDGDQILLQQTVSFIAMDECGNADTTTATIRVVDDQAPIITACVGDTIIGTNVSDCVGTFKVKRPPLTDECSPDTMNYLGLRFEYTIDGGSRILVGSDSVDVDFPQGTHQIKYYVTDCGGNQDSCSFQLTVIDNVPPFLACSNDLTVYVGQDSCQKALSLVPPITMDNCALDSNFMGPRPLYYINGATDVDETRWPESGPPTQLFNIGNNRVRYIMQDSVGNRDTCLYRVLVLDTIAPVVRCQPTTLFINPSGLDVQMVDVGDLDAGTTDNCEIDTMFITPNQFDCNLVGMGGNPNVVLTARDESGNSSTCTTFVRIENLAPSPTATSGLCGNDTLFLSANPPPADGGTVYTYFWFGPNGFTSTKANPFIPNISAVNAGSYSVEITGLTGCRSSGAVEVTIEDLPQTPDIQSEDDYCVNNIVTLESSITPQGVQVIYQWYRSDGGSGILLAETIVPSYSFQAPSTPGTEEYFLIIEADGCTSQPSLPKVVTFNDFPTAVPLDTNITICSGETVTLGTLVTGFGLSYEWTGPDGYEEEGAFPSIIRNATPDNDGVYSLVITRNGCASTPAFVRVNILPRPERPMLSNNGPICQGDNLVLSTNATASIYTWVAPDLTEFSTTSNSFSLNNVDPSLSGNWRLFVTDFNCDSELSIVSNVVINDLPNAVAAASPDIICEGSDIFLNASPNIANATYSWTGPDGFMGVGRNVSIENIRAAKAGQYTVDITTDAGCSQSADVMVNVRNAVQIVSAANDGAACLNGPTDISFNAAVFPEDDGSYVYSWTGPNGFSSNIRQAVIPNATSNNNGNYQLIVTNAEGCVSDPVISTVDVSDPPATPEQPVVSEFTPAPFCVGTELELRVGDYNGNAVSYHWQTPNDGVVITTEPALNIPSLDLDDSGDYSVFVNIDGCNSNPSSNLRINVNARPNASVQSNSPICEGDPINLVANFVAGASYSWIGPNFSSSLQNPTIVESDSALHAGSYLLVIQKDGCASAPINTNVVINATPIQPQLLGSGPICADDSSAILRINLSQSSMTNGATYIWSGPNGIIDTSDNPTIDISNFDGFADGENLFTATALLGRCPSMPSEPFSGQINQVPEITAFAGQDFTICETEDIFLSAEAPALGTGRWMYLGEDTTGSIIISNPMLPTTSVNGLGGNQSFEFSWVLSNGACENNSSDQVQISVNKVEDAFGGEDLIACAGTAVTLNANAVEGNSFWTQPEAQSLFGVRITDPTSPVTSITGLQPGNLYTFTWNVQGSCGDVRDDVFILVSDPNPFAGADIVACNDEGFAELMADAPTDGSIGTWSALDPDVVISADQSPNTVVTNLQPGDYQFVWEVDNGTCGDDSRDTVNVAFKMNPIVNPEAFAVGFGNPTQIDLLANDILPPNSTIEIISGPDHAILEDLGNGIYSFQPSFSYVGQDRILYEVCSDACECVMGEATFTIGRDATCDIPSIITPNNDGVNDQFIVPCLFDQSSFPNSQLLIFTRWGDEVFRSGMPYNNDWDGTFNGEVLPVGTYFYTLDYGDGEPPVSSFFMIQR